MPPEDQDIFTKIENDFKRHRSSVLRLLLVGGFLCILAGISSFQMEQRVHATGIVLRDEEFIIFSQSNELISRIEIEEGDEVEIVLTFFDHDKKRLHFKMEMIEKSSKNLFKGA